MPIIHVVYVYCCHRYGYNNNDTGVSVTDACLGFEATEARHICSTIIINMYMINYRIILCYITLYYVILIMHAFRSNVEESAVRKHTTYGGVAFTYCKNKNIKKINKLLENSSITHVPSQKPKITTTIKEKKKRKL